jgi:hypothetical protein
VKELKRRNASSQYIFTPLHNLSQNTRMYTYLWTEGVGHINWVWVGQVEIDGRSKVTTAVNDRVATEFNLPVAIPKITIDM